MILSLSLSPSLSPLLFSPLTVPLPPPPPTNVMVVQNGSGSVLVTWEIASSSEEFTFEVCYSQVGGSEVCPGSGIPKTTREYVVSNGIEIGVNYTFRVRSVNNLDRISSNDRTVNLSPCSGGTKMCVCVCV